MAFNCHVMEMVPYNASIEVKCISSTRTGEVITEYTDEENYNLVSDSIGKGDCVFLESYTAPMEMTYTAKENNGYLVDIETNLQVKNIKKDITGKKITEFTISDEDWFNTPNSTEEITINKEYREVETYLNYPYKRNINFKINNTDINYNTDTSILDDSVFRFNIGDNIQIGTEIQATYQSEAPKVEYITTAGSGNYSRGYTSEHFISGTVQGYKNISKEEINYKEINNNFIIFDKNINNIKDGDIIELNHSYPITNYELITINDTKTFTTKEQPQNVNIYIIGEDITITSKTPIDKYIRFNKSKISIGEKIIVEYTNLNYEAKNAIVEIEQDGNSNTYVRAVLPEYFLTTSPYNVYAYKLGDKITKFTIKGENITFTDNTLNIGQKLIIQYICTKNFIEYFPLMLYNKNSLKIEVPKIGSNITVYKLLDEIRISYKSLDLDNNYIFFDKGNINSNKVSVDETVILNYNYLLQTSETLTPLKANENNTTYIELQKSWGSDDIKIYDKAELDNLTALSYATKGLNYIRFRKEVVSEGEEVLVKYESSSESRIIYLILKAENYNSYYNVVNLPENSTKTTSIFAYKNNIEGISIKDKNLENKKIYFNEQDVDLNKTLIIIYNSLMNKEEELQAKIYNDNDNLVYIEPSKYFLSDNIIAKKNNIIDIMNTSSTGTFYSVSFNNNLVPIGDKVIVKYKYIKNVDETLTLQPSEESVVHCGTISENNKNKNYLRCINSDGIEIIAKKENDIIYIDSIYENEYDNKKVTIIFKKEDIYIRLCCNKVKVPCCFVNVIQSVYSTNGFECFLTDNDLVSNEDHNEFIFPSAFVVNQKNGDSFQYFSKFKKYITVSWSEEEINDLFYGNYVDKSGIIRWQIYFSYGKEDGTIVGFDGGVAGSTNQRIAFDYDGTNMPINGTVYESYTVPPLNGTEYITISGEDCYVKYFFQIGYTVNIEGFSGYKSGAILKIKGKCKVYDENGFIKEVDFGDEGVPITMVNGSPGLFEIKNWNGQNLFYKVEIRK